MINFMPMVYATVMALMDVVVLAWLKDYTLGVVSWKFVPLGMFVYGLQPFIFLQSLQYETMTVMNILWDLVSDLVVTATGLLYFKEKVTPIKQFALVLAFIAIVLFAYDDCVSENISKRK
jgi:multidrug transporter EmrE-like cation transporter